MKKHKPTFFDITADGKCGKKQWVGASQFAARFGWNVKCAMWQSHFTESTFTSCRKYVGLSAFSNKFEISYVFDAVWQWALLLTYFSFIITFHNLFANEGQDPTTEKGLQAVLLAAQGCPCWHVIPASQPVENYCWLRTALVNTTPVFLSLLLLFSISCNLRYICFQIHNICFKDPSTPAATTMGNCFIPLQLPLEAEGTYSCVLTLALLLSS